MADPIDYSKLKMLPDVLKMKAIKLRANNRMHVITKDQFLSLVEKGRKDSKLHLYFTPASIKKAKATTIKKEVEVIADSNNKK